MLADVEGGGGGGGTQVSFRSDGLGESFRKVKESRLQGSWGEFVLFHHETIECTERIVLQDLLKIVTVLFKIFTQHMQHPIS